MTHHEMEFSENMNISDSVSARTESEYLISSNKEKCSALLRDSALDENNIVDIFVSLHIVLEVSLNTLYRHITLLSIRKDVDRFEVIKNLDNISFIDKTILFIYNSKFVINTSEEHQKISEYHKVIGQIKSFSEMRNKLLHGHSISTIFDGERNTNSPLKKSISIENLAAQLKKYRSIVEGLRFYIDKLDSSLTDAGKASLKESYLSDSFLPELKTAATQNL